MSSSSNKRRHDDDDDDTKKHDCRVIRIADVRPVEAIVILVRTFFRCVSFFIRIDHFSTQSSVLCVTDLKELGIKT